MGIWIDTPAWHDVATLKARDVDGTLRYLCEPYNTGPGSSMPNKRLERAELDQKIAAGIDVAVNWEDAANDAMNGYNRGLDKGTKAAAWMLDVLDFPPGAVCCSSIDFDVPHWIGSAPQAYQFGWRDGLTQNGPYIPGIYGDTQALDGANDDGTAFMFWWSTAKAWSGGVRPKMVHLDQNGYWQWDNSADLNTVVIAPFGSYLHPLGDVDMTPDECKAALREVLAISPGGRFAVPKGQPDNDDVLALLVGLAQGQVNMSTKILQAASVKLDQAWLERVIVAAVGDALAGGIPVDTVTAVVKKAVDDALAASTIPITLTGHAGTPPTP